MQTLTGPVIEPASGKVKSLVIFLHGYGSNGDDLISIAEQWAPHMPDTAFLSPNAPDICEVYAAGFQWFPIRVAEGITTGAFDRKDIVEKPAAILNAYIDAQLRHYGLDENRLIVGGFSQGAMMAMYTMPRRKKPCAGVIGWSGMMVNAAGLKDPGIVKMPILAIHGDSDALVPPQMLEAVGQGFEAAGFDVETILRPGLPHGIDAFGLTRGLGFTKSCLGLPE